MTKLSFKRKITDYAKVQHFISTVMRGKNMFINKRRIKNLEYLDIGCGPNVSPDFVNLDYSWTPKIDICWDLIAKPLPFNADRFTGVYTEHCFEHIPFDNFEDCMREIYRVLAPGGTLRLIMPDAEIYIDKYVQRKNGADVKLPYQQGHISAMHRINAIFRNHGHQFIYDFETVNIILQKIGFENIIKQHYKVGRDQKLLKDAPEREVESLYVEASK